ncbi:ABC transporter ATP-binding protein [Mycena chlorophos]|uniref:ABC transporter ATP-binding protein n=1 Tax=Mycena chlorophos TaxID=658473 RepID=A0A8H6TFL2_MYCCL|nr:ABC transporter ATP-binding protein [Mycena chlorophos]
MSTTTTTDAQTEGVANGAPIESRRLGVYRLVTQKSTSNFREPWDNLARGFPSMKRLVKDIFQLNSTYLLLYLLIQVWECTFLPLLDLDLSSRILVIIEEGLKQGRPDATRIFYAVALKMISTVMTTLIKEWILIVERKLIRALEFKLQALVLRSKLRTDLTGAQGKVNHSFNEHHAWYAFRHFVFVGGQMAGVAGQLVYIFRTVQSSGHGPLVVGLCLVHPFFNFLKGQSLWSIPHVAHPDDSNFARRQNLLHLGDRKFKQDLITGDIVQHILSEFRKVLRLLGNTDISEPHVQYSRRFSPLWRVLVAISSDFPMIYYAGNAIFNPTQSSLATIATLQLADNLLGRSFLAMLHNVQRATAHANRVKAIYDVENVEHDANGAGVARYPPEGQAQVQGMAIELRNVSFSYPGNEPTKTALKNVSLTIDPGQLVVVVGANGSGKSTIVKLLMQLYQPSEGTILLAGRDMREYNTADLRRATAALTQDHHLFPLSLAENIGLGNPARVGDGEAIADAARRGGAEKVLERLKEGSHTTLERVLGLHWGNNVRKDDKTLLAAELERMSKNIDVSGGEKQRLVAARTFMRFTIGTVKLACVDEPSANLDPEGELELFDNLRLAREGMTMVFVTHRFGHLTQHADLIVCMKEGQIEEKGTHAELMALDREYAKMFRIQAKAFT